MGPTSGEASWGILTWPFFPHDWEPPSKNVVAVLEAIEKHLIDCPLPSNPPNLSQPPFVSSPAQSPPAQGGGPAGPAILLTAPCFCSGIVIEPGSCCVSLHPAPH